LILNEMCKRRVLEAVNAPKVEPEPGKPQSFINMLLGMRDENRLSLDDIQYQVNMFVFAGYDTTAQAISWTLWCMATHPDIQQRVHEEILQICDTEGDIGVEELSHMSYLELCVKEVLRMRPSVPIVTRVLRKDLVMGGKLVPKGANVWISPHAVHHNEQIFPDPFEFNPENFSEENCAKRHPYDYIPFSAGQRNCIGQKFAKMELKIVLAHLLREFHFHTDRHFGENVGGMETVLHPKLGMPLKVTRRSVTT